MRRPIALLALLALVLVVGGCGGKKDAYTDADTEGLYLRAGGLNYQIQVSRELNPALIQDSEALRGVTATPGANEVWFGVWLRVDNPAKQAKALADNFSITDTQGQEFRPVPLPVKNILSYQAGPLPPGGQYPQTDSVATESGPRAGALVLFKLNTSAYQNRPLDLNILSPDVPERIEAKVKLDL